jgi:SAM-dependent methyltransferase
VRRSRAFHWISSERGNPDELAGLEQAMIDFYSRPAARSAYQQMVDAESSAQPLTEAALCAAILGAKPQSVLEIGCGSGRIYERLQADGLRAAYTGLEMSAELVVQNRQNFPEARWQCGSVYNALAGEHFDIVFAYFVLEHCVYPARALESIMSVLEPGGAALLVFPDFVVMGRFASQALGFVEGNASVRLRRGDPLNAMFNLYESRIRLPRALRRAVRDHGPFPVNLNPRCLSWTKALEPDLDATYIASRREVHDWATARGHGVDYPAGTANNFRENVLMRLHKAAA